jgi:hypothetical protein
VAHRKQDDEGRNRRLGEAWELQRVLDDGNEGRRDYGRPVAVWDKIKTAAAAGGERRQAEGKRFVPSEPPPTYKEPREAIAMVLAYRDQIKFLDRLKLIAKAMKGLALDTSLTKALVAALTEGRRALKALEKEQEPVIAAGIAARKASEEAYTAAFKAWEARMERERAHWEKTWHSKDEC